MAAKVIPGLSLATRIVLLQQTATEDGSDTSAVAEPRTAKTVLQYILEGDEARNHILEELKSRANYPTPTTKDTGSWRASG